MKKIGMVLLGLGLFIPPLLHAQNAPLTPKVVTVAAAAAPQTDPIAFSNAPMVGQFYSAQNPDLPPAPSDFSNLPVWDLGDGNYLLDDFDSDLRRQSGIGGAVQDDSPPTPPGDGGSGGSPSTNGISYSFDTNGLWLEMVDVSTNGFADLNLRNATNQIYAIWGTSDLTGGWTVLTEVWPTNASVMPFTVPLTNQQTLFMQAEDWTGVTENGNTTPDWWFWEYFGTTALSDTNLDAEGSTLLIDNEYGIDPNAISFSLSVANQYLNTSAATVQIAVSAGTPSYAAVLVDSTNFAGATWNAYVSSNITVNLGTVQGWHNVWVGLRGLPPNAAQTWQWEYLNFSLPPVLSIISPAANVVSQPIIQINGYCQEPLASISYDVSNALGVVTNQPSEITEQFYDTNSAGFSTNYFECVDVPLNNGINTITIHAMDLAGNITITNFNFTLDYSSKTNPPSVQINWPQNGTQISGNSFTCRGWISDSTATVTGQLGPNGNIYPAIVERNGNFWIQNIPLAAGTNALSITVIDVVSNAAVTNISVVQSPLALAINPVTPSSQLWQPTVNVTGTISDTTYAIWVNGVKGLPQLFTQAARGLLQRREFRHRVRTIQAINSFYGRKYLTPKTRHPNSS